MAKSRRSIVVRKLRPAFLDALASGSTVVDASKAAGIGLRTAYDLRKQDAEFSAAWDEAYMQGASALEMEARRRAVEGTLKPVFNRGVQAIDYTGMPAFVREYSDTLLIVLLKARDPLRYCDRARTAALLRNWVKEDGAAAGVGTGATFEAIVDLMRRLTATKAAMADHGT